MNWITKLLISLIFFANTAVAEGITFNPEPIKPDGVITNVLSTFFFYESYAALWDAWPEYAGEIEAISLCERKVEQNIAYCDIHQVMPTIVDGEHTLSMGHEVEHGVFGEEYHEE